NRTYSGKPELKPVKIHSNMFRLKIWDNKLGFWVSIINLDSL
ncbi:hypothetical protein AAUPMC_03159, partial [Pasteurella multocida subsp. multocida str. Anand1_cattle]